ncbi:MAG: bactofilin family protein [Pyrinomonadaceae bacterium]
MIRMGRSSKTETTDNTNEYQEKPTNSDSSYSFSSNNQPSSTRAVSESESMARDIKEGRLSGFVGNGTVLTGETNFQTMLRVDGHLTGRVTSENGTLVVGSTGRVDANIVVAAAVINGAVNGDIVAAEKIELGRTARVVGNIQTPRLILEDGAILEGSCSMLKAKEVFDKRADESNSYPAADNYSQLEVSETEKTNGHFETTDEADETAKAVAN